MISKKPIVVALISFSATCFQPLVAEQPSQTLIEVRELLSDTSKSESDRINEALAVIDQELQQEKTAGPDTLAGFAIPRGLNQSRNIDEMIRQHRENAARIFSRPDPFVNFFESFRAMPNFPTPKVDFSQFERANPSAVDINVTNEENQLIIRVKADKLDGVEARVVGSSLQIQGSYEEIVENRNERGEITHRSHSSGSFTRSIPIPASVDAEAMRTRVADGEMVITLPKTKQ